MRITPYAMISKLSSATAEATTPQNRQHKPQKRAHQDHIGDSGASEHHFGLVHKPLPLPKAMQIEEARLALEREWVKLETKVAWDVTKVKSKAKFNNEQKTKIAQLTLEL